MNENSINPSVVATPPPSPEELSRRKFFRDMSVLLGGITVAGLAVPVIGFIVDPLVKKEPEVWRTVGKVDEFAIGKTVAVRYEDASPLPWAGVSKPGSVGRM